MLPSSMIVNESYVKTARTTTNVRGRTYLVAKEEKEKLMQINDLEHHLEGID